MNTKIRFLTTYSRLTLNNILSMLSIGVILDIIVIGIFLLKKIPVNWLLMLFIIVCLQIPVIYVFFIEFLVKKLFYIEIENNKVIVSDRLPKIYFSFNTIQVFQRNEIMKIETLSSKKYKVKDKHFNLKKLDSTIKWNPKITGYLSFIKTGLTQVITLKNNEKIYIRYSYLFNNEVKIKYKEYLMVTD
jgi:hypothetical protein